METILLKWKLTPEFKRVQVLPILPVDFSGLRRGYAAPSMPTASSEESITLPKSARSASPGFTDRLNESRTDKGLFADTVSDTRKAMVLVQAH